MKKSWRWGDPKAFIISFEPNSIHGGFGRNLYGKEKLNMSKQQRKKKFEVLETESIDDCLSRMNKEGYSPIRRMEEPIFHEINKEGQKDIEPCGRKIVFEGVLKE